MTVERFKFDFFDGTATTSGGVVKDFSPDAVRQIRDLYVRQKKGQMPDMELKLKLYSFQSRVSSLVKELLVFCGVSLPDGGNDLMSYISSSCAYILLVNLVELVDRQDYKEVFNTVLSDVLKKIQDCAKEGITLPSLESK